MRKAALLLLVVGLVTVLLVALMWGFQRRFVYFPDAQAVPSAASVIPGARDVTLRTADGLELGAWLVPAGAPARGVSVLVANGNGGDRSVRAPLARALAAEGMQVLLFDYRGYGGNPGSPTEEGLAGDVRAARQYLLDTGVPADRIVYFGESLGTAVVTELAAEHPPGAMLLRSPFVDLPSLGEIHYPWAPVRSVLREKYPLVEHLAKVDVPVTVVYGTADTIVPPRQSQLVAQAAPDLRQLVAVEGAGHNDLALLDGRELVEAVVDLAEYVERPA